MSEFLGPIHYMMYEKIKFQDKITDFLLDGKTEEIDEKKLNQFQLIIWKI